MNSGNVIIAENDFLMAVWDEETETDKLEIITRPMRYLRNAVEITDRVTLGSLFALVDRYPSLVHFFSAYSRCPVADYHTEAKLPVANPTTISVEYLEISRCVLIDAHPLRPDLEERIDFSGIGPSRDEFTGEVDPEGHWSVSMTPTNQLAHLPLRLNLVAPVVNYQKGDADRLETSTTFSLLEVLDAIYYDISFYGRPSERDATLVDLNNQIKEI